MKTEETTTKPHLTPAELESFLIRHDLTNSQFAEVLGVSRPAVDHWLIGRRNVPPTVVKLVDYFDRKPEAVMEFM